MKKALLAIVAVSGTLAALAVCAANAGIIRFGSSQRAAAGAPITADFFVATNGSDSNACTTTAAPCLTPVGARNKLRTAMALPGGKDRSWAVMLRGGRYDLTTRLVLDQANDSVNDPHAVTWREYPGESVTISGGFPVTGWVVGGDGRWRVTLPEVQAGTLYFSDIWVNGIHSSVPIRPRLKTEVPFTMVAMASSTGDPCTDVPVNIVNDLWGGCNGAAGGGSNRFTFTGSQLLSTWTNLTDIRIRFNDNFSYTSQYRLSGVDGGTHIATMQAHSFTGISGEALRRDWRRENVFEDLTDAGEHYLNRTTGELTYIPRPGETPANSTVIAPYLPRLLSISNNGNASRAQNITFSGLTFAYTLDHYARDGWVGVGPNAEYLDMGSIYVQAARNIKFLKSTLEHIGGTAIRIGRGAQAVTLDGVLARDLGGGMVTTTHDSRCPIDRSAYWPAYDTVMQCPTGAPDQVAFDEDANGHIIKNFIVTDYGKKRTSVSAVHVGHGSNNLVSHGEIYGGPSMAVHIGGTDSCINFGENINNTTEYLSIHDQGYGGIAWSWDYAGLYHVGPNEGGRVHHNYIRNIKGSTTAQSTGARGLYADNCATGITFDNNVVYDTGEANFNFNFGSKLVLENNIFVLGGNQQIRGGNMSGGAPSDPSYTFTKNVVYSNTTDTAIYCSHGVLFCATSTPEIVENNGVYYRTPGTFTMATRDQTIADWITTGSPLGPQSQNTSWNVDPLLIDPTNPRLGLQAGSPAFAKGFVQIDLSTIGPIGAVGAP